MGPGRWTRIEPTELVVTGKANHLLAALPESGRRALAPELERRWVLVGEELYQPTRRLRHVFFPVDCVVSLLTVLDDGRSIETATVGREGMVGLFVFLNDDRSANRRAIVQMGGEILRLPADALREATGKDTRFGTLMLDYTRAMMVHISQSAACNAVHTVPQRLARWLLQTSHRTGSAEIRLTHQFLAEVLGVRRASVTGAVRRLSDADALKARRGAIIIDDRAALERSACECFRVVQDAYARLTPG